MPLRQPGPCSSERSVEQAVEAGAVFASLYPAAVHITATDAGHYIHEDNPRLVTRSIRDVVDQVR